MNILVLGWASHIFYLPVIVEAFSVPDPNREIKGPKKIFISPLGLSLAGSSTDFILFWVTLTQLRLNVVILVYTSFVHFKTMQILEMESSLRERRDSFEQDMSSMTLKLEKARQETNQEVLNLRKLKVVLFVKKRAFRGRFIYPSWQ